jgi:hypothetical protein
LERLRNRRYRDNPQTVLKAADDAMYRAKAGGRNRVELSSAGSAGTDAPPRPSLEMALTLSGSDYTTDEDSEGLVSAVADAS